MTNQQFKIGDKVRFRQDGETGIMNKYMYANNVMLDRIYEVTDITGGVARIIGNGLYFDVPYACLELVPEPQPKFANIKVGDWVEISTDPKTLSNFKHVVVTGLSCNVIPSCIVCGKYIFEKDGTDANYRGNPHNHTIIRILSPKEVVVDFGSGIKGTIEKACDTAYFLVWHSNNDCDYSMIKLAALDNATRAIVESLLKAQEEE